MKYNMKTTKLLNYLLLLPLSFIFIFTSCKNELDINAEYEDINIVYGVFDPSVQRQYIRINRAFLTDENALIVATNPDSSNYPYKLNVTVVEYNKNNQLVKVHEALTDTLPKTEGVFNTGYQVFYYIESTDIFRISDYGSMGKDTLYFNPENRFKLIVENPVTGEVSEAETYLIDNVNPSRPASKLLSFVSTNSASGVIFRSVQNGALYEAKYIFYYREVYLDNPTDTIYKEIHWKLGSVKTNRISGGEEIKYTYVPHTFFNILKNQIPQNSNVKRYHGKFVNNRRIDVHLIISTGALELSSYIDANKPSSSIIQDRPVYTNISNGVGIFSSRKLLKLELELNQFTVDSLRNGSVSYLNFQ